MGFGVSGHPGLTSSVMVCLDAVMSLGSLSLV